MRNFTINMTRHYEPTVLSQQVLALINWKPSVISTPPTNPPSVLYLDLNTSEGASSEIATDYFQMIRNKNQVDDKYKARINKV